MQDILFHIKLKTNSYFLKLSLLENGFIIKKKVFYALQYYYIFTDNYTSLLISCYLLQNYKRFFFPDGAD